MTHDEAEELVDVKLFVFDGNSPIPTRFTASRWDAFGLIHAFAHMYLGDHGGIVVDGEEWEGTFGKNESFQQFTDALVPRE